MVSHSKYTLFYILLLLFAACKPDSDMPCRAVVERIDGFTTAEELLFQMQTFDSLWYVNAANDTVLLTKLTQPTQYAKIPLRSNPDCKADSLLFPNLTLSFKNENELLHWRFSISKSTKNILIQSVNDSASFSFNQLNNTDSIDLTEFNTGTRTFQNIYIAMLGSDSLYYTTSQGIVRFKNLTLIQWK